MGRVIGTKKRVPIICMIRARLGILEIVLGGFTNSFLLKMPFHQENLPLLPVDRLFSLTNKIFIGLAKVLASEETSICSQGRWMWSFEY